VLHVINQLGARAGAEVSLRDFIVGSAGRGVVHGVAVLRSEDALPESFLDLDVETYTPAVPLGRSTRVRHVARAIGDFAPDIVHTSLYEADLAGRVAGWLTSTPVLTSFVNTPYGPEARAAETVDPRKLELVLRSDRFLAAHATSAFHAISAAAAAHAVEHLHIEPERIRVVPRGRSVAALGVRSDERIARVRRAEGWEGRPVVINVARQEPQKGQVHLIDGWMTVLESRPDALLVIVGREGRSTADLRRRIERHRCASSVRFTGVRTDVADLVAAADVFAFSSLYEGLGGAVVEAAGLGVPIVSVDLPAVREIVGSEHEWLVPPVDPTALGAAVLQALTDHDLAARVGAASRERFLERFELSAAVEGMLRMYRDLLEGLLTRGERGTIRRVPRLGSWS
jgi:glycosyltransferase involved in cell wall biosynthesis